MSLTSATNMHDCGELTQSIDDYCETNNRGLSTWTLHKAWYSSVINSNSRILALEPDSCTQSVRNSSLEKKKISSMTHKKKNEKEGFQIMIMKRE